MSYQSHRASGEKMVANCAVITLSDTRTEATDASGAMIRKLLGDEGHNIVHYEILADDTVGLRATVRLLLNRAEVDAILTNGGTGVSRRDQTIAVMDELIETPLPGFGELFRMLSWEQIGSGAIMSRCTGGIASGKLLFAMPGSTAAVELAMRRLILPEIRHLLFELRK